MAANDKVFITFYDDESDAFKYSWLRRSTVEPFLDRAPIDALPSPAPGAPITNEDARLLGGMAFMSLVGGRQSLRDRLEIVTATPMDWTPPVPPTMPATPPRPATNPTDGLKAHGNFRHWHIDIMAAQGRDLTLGLSLDSVRTTITFQTATRCSIENFGITNIVGDIAILEDGTQAYDDALVKLSSCKRLHRAMQPNWIVSVSSAVGVNALVECVAISVQP
ncbi:hypothetical protein SBC1_01690 [Caballeronia sp. SBC1]|uniref:hypothetical protein n=1 Tax=Caballeronia sp. SBC1 TaxID=2705548 RepID=UPI00140B7EE6|nr:hypothetical protein [Caballeronia sp. SBC1]QIN60194.1 hypothetical protein SBC1_01690 [Caballeronia sp. SBC1]